MRLGDLSAQYESNGNPASVSSGAGDAGGKSYGSYQLSSKMGAVSNYLKYIKTKYADIYKHLSMNPIGSAGFDAQWRNMAKVYPKQFDESQWLFIKALYYDATANSIKSKISVDINKRSMALQQVLWSRAVQMGQGGAANIFCKTYKAGITDANWIKAVYAECSANTGKKYFPGCSLAVRLSVCNRFRIECNQAVKMIK